MCQTARRASSRCADRSPLWLPGAPVLLLLDAGVEHLVLDALRCGAQGYLIKGNCRAADVISAVQALRRGEAVLSPRVVGLLMDDLLYRDCSNNPQR